MKHLPAVHRALTVTAIGMAAALLAGCATPPEPQGSLRKETLLAITSGMELVKFNAGAQMSAQV